MKEINQLKRIIEGALFASDRPMSMDQLLVLFEPAEQPEKKEIRQMLEELKTDYQGRGIELKELASGWQFQVVADLSRWIQRLFEERAAKYSRAFLETLAIIAYRQPITRGEIEEIRGVVVNSHIIKTMIEREWVREVGHREVPGRPALLATTKQFLDYFGLKRLEDLPSLSEVQNFEALEERLRADMIITEEVSNENFIEISLEETHQPVETQH